MDFRPYHEYDSQPEAGYESEQHKHVSVVVVRSKSEQLHGHVQPVFACEERRITYQVHDQTGGYIDRNTLECILDLQA